MFTIRNNQINVNSEIIGGMPIVRGSVSPPNPPAPVTPPGQPCALLARLKAKLQARSPATGTVPNSLLDKLNKSTLKGGSYEQVGGELTDIDDIKDIKDSLAGPGFIALATLTLLQDELIDTAAKSTDENIRVEAIVALNMVSNAKEALASGSGNIELITSVGKLGAKKDWIRGDTLDLVYTETDGTQISLETYYVKKGTEATLKNQTLENSLKCFSKHTDKTAETVPNADPCMNVLFDSDVLNMNSVEVAKLHPEVVFGVLKFLGFQMQESGGLNQVQSWSAWLKTVNGKRMNEAALARATTGATHWQGQNFVSNLINFINSRPAILNKGASSKVEDVRKIGLAASKNSFRTDLSNHRNAIDMALNTLMFQVRGLMPRAGLAPFNAYSAYTASGGAMVVPVGVQPSRRASIDRLPEFTKQLRNLYNGYVQRLESMKKTLSPNTKDQVEGVFKQCEEHEAKVKSLLTHFDSYARLSQLDGNRAEKEYNATDLHESYSKLEKHVGKSRRRYWSILDIAGVTGDAASDAEGTTLVLP